MRGSMRVTWRCPHQKESTKKTCRKTDCTGSWYGRVRYEVNEAKKGGHKNKEEAETWAAKKLGEWTTGVKKDDKPRHTVGQLLDVWLAEQFERTKRVGKSAPELEMSSYKAYERHVRLHIRPLLNDVFLDELTHQKVKTFHRRLRDKTPDISRTQLIRVTATLSIAINYAMRNRMFFDPINPCSNHIYLGDTFEGKSWSTVSIRSFWALAQLDEFFGVYASSLLQGVRRGEALAMHEDAINNDVWHVHEQIIDKDKDNVDESWPYVKDRLKTHKKGTKEKFLVLQPEMLQIIEMLKQRRRELEAAAKEEGRPFHKDPDGRKLLFIDKNGMPYSPIKVTKRFEALCSILGLPKVRLHDLRHTFINLLRDAGADMPFIKEVVGHSPESTVTEGVYTHVQQDHQRAINARVGKLLSLPTFGQEDEGPDNVVRLRG